MIHIPQRTNPQYLQRSEAIDFATRWLIDTGFSFAGTRVEETTYDLWVHTETKCFAKLRFAQTDGNRNDYFGISVLRAEDGSEVFGYQWPNDVGRAYVQHEWEARNAPDVKRFPFVLQEIAFKLKEKKSMERFSNHTPENLWLAIEHLFTPIQGEGKTIPQLALEVSTMLINALNVVFPGHQLAPKGSVWDNLLELPDTTEFSFVVTMPPECAVFAQFVQARLMQRYCESVPGSKISIQYTDEGYEVSVYTDTNQWSPEQKIELWQKKLEGLKDEYKIKTIRGLIAETEKEIADRNDAN